MNKLNRKKKNNFNGAMLTRLIEKMALKEKVKRYIIRRAILHKTGISKQTLAYWESGAHSPSLHHIFYLKEFFKLKSMEELIN